MAERSDPGSKLNVFISYSRVDIDFADQLDATLRIGGFDTAIDRHGIHAGEDWKKRLGNLIRDADTVIFVLSPSSARSDICAWEVGEAVRLGKRILPVVAKPLSGERAPPALAALNYIYFYAEPTKPGTGFGPGLIDLVTALNTDLDWLREHTRLLQRASEWDANGRTESRLLFGENIAEAKAWAERRPKDAPEPTQLHFDFIRASEEAEARRQSAERRQLEEMAAAQAARADALAAQEQAQKREAAERAAREAAQRQAAEHAQEAVRRTRLGLVVAGLLFVVASVAAAWGWKKQGEAREQADVAVEQTHVAEAATADALRQKDIAKASEARAKTTAREEARISALYRAEQSTRALSQGDAVTAGLLALEGLRDETSDDEHQKTRDLVPQAWHALHGAFYAQRERRLLAGHESRVTSAAFSPDGARIVTASEDKTARLWDRDGAPLATLKGHESSVASAAFSPDGARIVTASWDKTARLSDAYPILQSLIDRAKHALPRCLTPDQRQTLHLPARAPSWCDSTRKWPHDAASSVVQGKLRLSAKDWSGAARAFEETIRKAQSAAAAQASAAHQLVLGEAYMGLAKAREQSGDTAAAAAFEEAARLGQDVGLFYVQVGHALPADKPEEKLAAYSEAERWASLEPPHPRTRAEALIGRAGVYERREQYADAVAAYRAAQTLGHEEAEPRAWLATQELARHKQEAGDFAEALLIAWRAYAELTPQLRRWLDTDSLNPNLVRIGYPIGKTPRSGSASTDCDRLAEHPFDPLRVGNGITFDKMDDAAALAACDAAIARDATQPRLRYQRARARAKAANEAARANNEDAAKEHHAAEQADLKAAMEAGYPMAFNNMAVKYENGTGVEKDRFKAGSLYVEFFNRVMACCWEPVARDLLAEADKHDPALVRRAVRDLTLWSAALGSEPSRTLLAEQTSNGTLEPAPPPLQATFTDPPPWLKR